MRTEDLIRSLAADAGPVDTSRTVRDVLAASLFGGALALGAVWATIGIRPDLVASTGDARVIAKLIFPVVTAVAAGLATIRLASPGRSLASYRMLLAAPFLVMAALACLELARADPSSRLGLVLGQSWSFCLTYLPPYAIAPFVLLVPVLRRAAPTDLTGAGLAVGLLSGSLAALGYALHCTEDAMPFVATWYVIGILAVGLAGAVLVPRLVRW